MHLDPEILQCFLDECAGLLVQCSEAASRCRRGEAEPADVEQLRRVFHTLKGNAAVVGVEVLAEAAGSLERLMRIFEVRSIVLDDRALGLVERSHSRLESMLSAIRRGAEHGLEPEWTRHLQDSVDEINAVYLDESDTPISVRVPVPPIAPSRAAELSEPEIAAPEWEKPAETPKRNRSTDVVSTPVTPPKKSARRPSSFALSGRLEFAADEDLGVLAARIRPLIEPYGGIASWRVGVDDASEIAFAFAEASLTDLVALARVLAREGCAALNLELRSGLPEEPPSRVARRALLEEARRALSPELEGVAINRRAAASRTYGILAGVLGFPSRAALALELAEALAGEALVPAPTRSAAAQRLGSAAQRERDPAEFGAARALRRQRGGGTELELLGAWIGKGPEATPALEPRELTWSWRELADLEVLRAAIDELSREGELVGAAMRAVDIRQLKAVFWIDPTTATGFNKLSESLRWERARIQRQIPVRLDTIDELIAVLARPSPNAERARALAARLRRGPAAPLLDHLRLCVTCVGVVRPAGAATPVTIQGDAAQADLHLLRLLRRPLTALFQALLRVVKASKTPGARLDLRLEEIGDAGALIRIEALGLDAETEAPHLEALRALGVGVEVEGATEARQIRLSARRPAAASRALLGRIGEELVALVPSPSGVETRDPQDETPLRQFAELFAECPESHKPAAAVVLDGQPGRWALDEAIGVEEVYRAAPDASRCATRSGEARVLDLVWLREQLEADRGG